MAYPPPCPIQNYFVGASCADGVWIAPLHMSPCLFSELPQLTFLRRFLHCFDRLVQQLPDHFRGCRSLCPSNRLASGGKPCPPKWLDYLSSSELFSRGFDSLSSL